MEKGPLMLLLLEKKPREGKHSYSRCQKFRQSSSLLLISQNHPTQQGESFHGPFVWNKGDFSRGIILWSPEHLTLIFPTMKHCKWSWKQSLFSHICDLRLKVSSNNWKRSCFQLPRVNTISFFSPPPFYNWCYRTVGYINANRGRDMQCI